VNKTTSFFKKILLYVLIGVIALSLLVASIKIYYTSTFYKPDEGYYIIPTEDEMRLIMHIDGYEIEMIYADEYDSLFGKITYDTSWTIWNHFAGDLYFRSDSILSARIAPKECTPTTVKMRCTNNLYCDTFYNESFEVMRNDKAIEDTIVVDIFFYDSYIIIDGMKLEKMESLGDEVLQELLRLFIDPVLDGEK